MTAGAAAQRAADRQCATGDRWPERPVTAGVQGLATHCIVRWSTPLANGDLNVRGYEAPTGPLLASAPWPQVLVTEARSLDGRSLDLALRPHEHPAGQPVQLRFSQLDPGARYRLSGSGRASVAPPSRSGRASVAGEHVLVAAPDGTATVDVTLAADGATQLRLVPAGGAA